MSALAAYAASLLAMQHRCLPAKVKVNNVNLELPLNDVCHFSVYPLSPA